MSFDNKMKLDIKCGMNDGRSVLGCYDYYTGSFIILLPIKIVYLSGGAIHHVCTSGQGDHRTLRDSNID